MLSCISLDTINHSCNSWSVILVVFSYSFCSQALIFLYRLLFACISIFSYEAVSYINLSRGHEWMNEWVSLQRLHTAALCRGCKASVTPTNTSVYGCLFRESSAFTRSGSQSSQTYLSTHIWPPSLVSQRTAVANSNTNIHFWSSCDTPPHVKR